MSLSELGLGLAFFGLLVFTVCGYIVWNIRHRGKEFTRMVDRDAKEFRSDPGKKDEFARSAVPALIVANSALAGLTFAALVIVIGFIIFEKEGMDAAQEGIMYTVLGLTAIATICFFFSLEQLIHMLAPSTDTDKMVKFYRFSFNLWAPAMVALICAILLLLLLANLYLAMIVGLAATVIAIRYFRVLHDWDKEDDSSPDC